MNFKNYIHLLLVLFISLIINCESKSSDDEEKLRVAAGLVLSRLVSTGSSTSSVATGITCSTSAPSFSSLSSAGVNSSCGRSGCHSGASPQSGLDATSYTSILTKVSAGNATSSLLFQKVNGGTMQVYTTSSITTAIYCWIQGGALP